MDVLHHDFHEDDAYDRDCTAFKVVKDYEFIIVYAFMFFGVFFSLLYVFKLS